MIIRLLNEHKQKLRWEVWRDSRAPAYWTLRTHDGVLRNLGSTWERSVPRIRLIAENYGLIINQGLD